MTNDEIISVVQAHKEGKQIQRKGYLVDIWEDVTTPDWNFQFNEYRIKPEPRKPREWWIHVSPDSHPFDCAYKSPDAIRTKLVRVREVIEINGKEVIWCE